MGKGSFRERLIRTTNWATNQPRDPKSQYHSIFRLFLPFQIVRMEIPEFGSAHLGTSISVVLEYVDLCP